MRETSIRESASQIRESASQPDRACRVFDSPIGRIAVVADQDAVRQVRFGPAVDEGLSVEEIDGPEAALRLCHLTQTELAAYLAGELREFTAPVNPEGTPFRAAVWEAMCEIPYGETLSYGGLAAQIGQPGATQAVGSACGANPIPLIIPCHRVLAAGGRIGGFSGGSGTDTKRWLLDLERGGWLF